MTTTAVKWLKPLCCHFQQVAHSDGPRHVPLSASTSSPQPRMMTYESL
jgi:hypothetical protein